MNELIAFSDLQCHLLLQACSNLICPLPVRNSNTEKNSLAFDEAHNTAITMTSSTVLKVV